MILVDAALARRAGADDPVRVGLVGAGFSGSRIAHQIITAAPGLQLVAIANRTLATAEAALTRAGVGHWRRVDDPEALARAIDAREHAVTTDASVLWSTPAVDVIVEATGTVEFGASVALASLQHAKHVILVNVEMDATVGPALRHYADHAGVIYSNCDGDEPGVAMNLLRLVRSFGLDPVVAGNLKGFYDRYRTPTTQARIARMHRQKPAAMASFADGTKLSMELAVLANATGFRVARRGMHGPALKDVAEAPIWFADKLMPGGMVDYLCGARPGNGAFVLARTENAERASYLDYLKMGSGPLYAFHTPFHLPHLEVTNSVARAALFGDAVVTPLGVPVADAVAVAKRDLKAGEVLDGLGGYCCYALLENYREARGEGLLAMGVATGCRLRRAVPRDRTLTLDDVELPGERLSDALRAEQDALLTRALLVAAS